MSRRRIGGLAWVEYRELDDGQWVPFSIMQDGALYDVEWSKRDECLYADQSGSGGDDTFCVNRFTSPGIHGKIWIAPGVKLVHQVQGANGKWSSVPLPVEQLASRGYELLDAPLHEDPLSECNTSGTRYCQVCDDWLPSDSDNMPCEHMIWSDARCDFVGCGSEQTDDDARRCVREVLATLTEVEVVALRRGLLGRHYRTSVHGFLLGSDWLEFDVGGRWADGLGGNGYREKDAPPDTDDPVHGSYLVSFPVPGGEQPDPIVKLGEKLTDIARAKHDKEGLDEQDDWMTGVSWLRTLDAAAPGCREAEEKTADWIVEWLAEQAGFSVTMRGS